MTLLQSEYLGKGGYRLARNRTTKLERACRKGNNLKYSAGLIRERTNVRAWMDKVCHPQL